MMATATSIQATTRATATSNNCRRKRRRASGEPVSTGGPGSPSGRRDGRSAGRSVIGEAVADAVNRQHVAGPVGIGLQLSTNVLDVRVHRPFVGLDHHTLDRIEQLGPREYPARLTR